MSIHPQLRDAEQVFRELGWEGASLEDALTLPLGTKEQQKRALAGLRGGEWDEVEYENRPGLGTHLRRKSLLTVDGALLAIFAIRVGVSPTRTLELLRWIPQDYRFPLMSQRSPASRRRFVTAACRPTQRLWEDDLSTYGELAVALVIRGNLDLPDDVHYFRDWAYIAARLLPTVLTSNDPPKILTLPEILPSFGAHLPAAIALSVSATGPFGLVIPAAVTEGIITREEAITSVIEALDITIRPSERRQWLDILFKDLAATDTDLLAHVERLIPLVASAEPVFVESVACPIIPLVDQANLADLALSALYVRSMKALKRVVQSLAQRSAPDEDVLAIILPRLEELLRTRDSALRTQIRKLLTAWGIETPLASPTDLSGDGSSVFFWRATPPLWEVPAWCPPEPTFDGLSHALSKVIHQPVEAESLEHEGFLASAIEVAYRDPADARRAFVGCPESFFDRAIYWWAHEGPGRRNHRFFWDGPTLHYQRMWAVFSYLGTIPCLLSAPSKLDMTISINDLIERLRRYEEAGARVLAPDLTMALLRLDMQIDDIPAARHAARMMEVRVKPQRMMPFAHRAGKILAAYLADPAVEPESFPLGHTHAERRIRGASLPRALRGRPKPCLKRRPLECSPAIFPFWRRFHALPLRWSENVTPQLGFTALQIARSAQPLSAEAAINLLGVQRATKSLETGNHCAQALRDAWERGLLVPGVADVRSLDYQETPSSLKAFAEAMREFAQEGMLSLIWPVLDDLIALSAARTDMLAGTSTLSELMADCAPAVRHAIDSGVAPMSATNVPGLRALAARPGSSKAVRAAREAIALLPDRQRPPVKQRHVDEAVLDMAEG